MKKSSEFICVRFKRILRRKYCITLVQGGIRKRRRRRRRKKRRRVVLKYLSYNFMSV